MTSIIGTSIRSSMALLVTLGLFGIMISLIAGPPLVVEAPGLPKMADFIQQEPEKAPETITKVEPPEAIEPTPPTLLLTTKTTNTIDNTFSITHETPTIDIIKNTPSSGSLASIVTVAPIYPPRAVQRGIEGHCTVEFVVTAAGTTRDVGVVEDDCSHSIFWRASIKAAQKFKYAPKREGGAAVASYGVRKRFTYNLE